MNKIWLLTGILFLTACGTEPVSSEIKSESETNLHMVCRQDSQPDHGYAVRLYGSDKEIVKAEVLKVTIAGEEKLASMKEYYDLESFPPVRVFYENVADAGYSVSIDMEKLSVAVGQKTLNGTSTVADLPCQVI